MQPATPFTSQHGPSTTTLIQRCLGGDARAWEQLVARYARLVHAVPVRFGLPPDDVDDVGQEVFLILAQRLHTIDDPERLPAWLITTARRVTWRARQRRRDETPLHEEDGEAAAGAASSPLVSAQPTPHELVNGWARQEAIYAALARLQARCRELLTLIFLDAEEPSYDAISAQLGIPKGSIGPTRNRCLQQLRTILEGLDVNHADGRE